MRSNSGSDAEAIRPIHLIGNAHLDPAWMWQMSEGLEAFAATCRSALDRIQEFPDFIFTCSSAAHYAFIEETDPTLFVRIQEAILNNRWAVVGGWWVEADCNLPSGESFIRQALLGQRYFESRFGRIATVGYNIDSFGHNGNLPQLLKKAGMDSYVFMRPNQSEKALSAALFEWESPSGDRVAAYRLPLHYSNYEISTREKLDQLSNLPFYRADSPWMIFFGVGNHGGGPTIAELRDIEILRAECSNVVFSSPQRFFDSINRTNLPIILGEMQPHAIGCYSAHSEIKQLHRRTERELRMAERVGVLALLCALTHATPIPDTELSRAWKNLCFNEFHDLLGGVAIQEACDDAVSMYREAISIAERIRRRETHRLAMRVNTSDFVQSIIVFNLAAHERKELVEFELWQAEEDGAEEPLSEVALIAADGSQIPTQRIEPSGKIGDDRARFLARAEVPAFGWSTFGIKRLRLPLTELRGMGGALGVPLAADTPSWHTPVVVVTDNSDTWGHGARAFMDFEEPFHVDSTETIERSPLRHGVRIKSSGDASWMEEELFWEPDNSVVEIRYFLSWHEKHKMLKLRYRHGCANPVARYEIPYAWMERPIGTSEWPGQSWVSVAERDGSHGLAIVTDSKYSYSVDDTFIYVVAARSPLVAHHIPPHEFQKGERERYLDQGEQEFRVIVIPHEGNWSGALLTRFSLPLIASHVSSHAGTLPKMFSGFECVSRGIHIGAMKAAEDGSGIIVRAVEQAGEGGEAEFSFPSLGARWSAAFTPFEIKSFLIRNSVVTEVDFLERAR